MKPPKKLSHITYQEALDKRLAVMDLTAFTLSQENKLPVIVFNILERGALYRIVLGEALGTIVTS